MSVVSFALAVVFIISEQPFITNLYKWDACGRGISDTIVPLSIPVLVVQVRDYRLVFRLPLHFCF